MRVRMQILNGEFVPMHNDTPLLLPSGFCLVCHNSGRGYGYGPCPICRSSEPMGDREKLEAERDELEEQKETLSNDLDAAENKIAELEEKIKALEEKPEAESATQDV